MAKLVEVYPCAPATEEGRSVSMSSDPKTNSIAYCNYASVVLYYLDNPSQSFVYNGHWCRTTVVRISPHGRWVASADCEGYIRIWNRKGEDHPLFDNYYPVMFGGIDDLQWSPDESALVVSGSRYPRSHNSFSVRFFFVEKVHHSLELDGHTKQVLSCAFKPTLPPVVVTGGSDALVNIHEGEPLKHKNTCKGHSDAVSCISFSPDGHRFISFGHDKKGFLYDGNSGKIVGELPREGMNVGHIFCASWSQDSKHVLTVSADNSAQVWEIDDDSSGGILKKTLMVPGLDSDDMLVGCVSVNDEMVVASLHGLICVYSAHDLDKPPVLFTGHVTCVNALSCLLLHDQNEILSSSCDGTIFRWKPYTGYVGQVKRKNKSEIKCFTAVKQTILVSGNDNKVSRICYNISNGCWDEEIIEVVSQPICLNIAHECHDHSLITTESAIIILKGSKVVSTITLDILVTASAIAPNGSEVVFGDKTGKLHIYSIQDANMVPVGTPLEKHFGEITVVQYSPNGKYFISSDNMHESVVWSRSSHEVIMNNLLYHMSAITCMAWSPDSRKIATGSVDRSIIVYEVGKHPSRRVTIEEAHARGANFSKGVYGLAFIDDKTLASGGSDGCVRLWSITPN